jgi:hypothetical protein
MGKMQACSKRYLVNEIKCLLPFSNSESFTVEVAFMIIVVPMRKAAWTLKREKHNTEMGPKISSGGICATLIV